MTELESVLNEALKIFKDKARKMVMDEQYTALSNCFTPLQIEALLKQEGWSEQKVLNTWILAKKGWVP